MKNGYRFLIVALVAVALAALVLIAPGEDGAIAQTDILYVDADATGLGDGTSWEDAFTTLQPALDAAGTGYQIWVVEGTYKPTAEHGGIGDRFKSFQMVNGVAIYGGFAGTEEFLDDRDWMTHVTILSGDIGTEGASFDNSYHVFYHPSGTGLAGSAILDGFTITGGNANGAWPHYDGGGMYNYGSSPTLSNCTFSGNSAYGTDPMWPVGNGGGMYNVVSSSPTLTNCTFSGNSASSRGGGIYGSVSSAILTDCTFSGNSAMEGGGMFNAGGQQTLTNCTFSNNSVGNGGGGMYNQGSSPTLTDCSFAGNSADKGGGMYNEVSSSPALTNCSFHGNSAWDGGGMYNTSGSLPTLTDCTFSSNSAHYGGGVYNWSSSPTLSNCTFSDNSADYWGGGIYNYQDSAPMLTDCTFAGNSASTYGGGMYNEESSPTLTDCTFSDNSADYGIGGGMYNYEASSPMLTNCTFAGNSASTYGGGMANTSGSSPTLTNCTFSDNTAGINGIGGGMYNGDGSPTLSDCAFNGNSAGNSGGGMSNGGGSPTLTNCTFAGNSAVYVGGGMANGYDSSPTLTNCTFADNSAGLQGGGLYNGYGSSPTLTNCILWEDIPEEIYDSDSTAVVTYSDVQEGYVGEGNIDADPLFADAASGDYHLGPGSPCIDVGNNETPNLPEFDFEGDARILDGDGNGTDIVDMGVDEVVYAGPPVMEVEIDIRPGSDQNPINLASGGVVPVAILTTDEFDAGTVRPASVRFAGAAPRRWVMEDVDRDGDLDLLLNFRIRELELDGSSTEATLRGETFPHAGGVLIEGTDTVRIIP